MYHNSFVKLQPERPIKIIDCPVCGGSGKRIDQKTHMERKCVACDNGLIKVRK